MVAKYVFVGMLTLLAAVQVKAGEDEDYSVPEASFEVIDEPLTELRIPGPDIQRAKHVASAQIETEQGFSFVRAWSTGRLGKEYALVGVVAEVLQTGTAKSFLREQKDLIADGNAIIQLKAGGDTKRYFFLGVDKEQAQKTAVAFLEYLAASAEKKRVEAAEEMKKWEGELEEGRKAYTQKNEESNAAQRAFEAKQTQTHYLSEESAKAAIERMNTIIETQVIEHAVLKAKLEAVTEGLAREERIRKEQPSSGINRQVIVLRLEEKRTEFTIEERALGARLEAAGKIRGDAEEYMRLSGQMKSLGGAAARLARLVENAYNALEKAKMARESAKPPKIIDNRITVQPLG